MNVSKLLHTLTESSSVFVPVDDPAKEVLDEISEVYQSYTLLIYFNVKNFASESID